MDWKVIENELKKPFQASEIEWRAQSVGFNNNGPWAMVLAYVQARAIQNRLDEVVGPENWKAIYQVTEHGVLCTLSIWDDERDMWIDKQDGAEETDIEAFKGGISSALKRVAAAGWGIGRYLYKLEVNFAEANDKKTKKFTNWAKTKDGKSLFWATPKLPAWALPEGAQKEMQEIVEEEQPEFIDEATMTHVYNELLDSNTDLFKKIIKDMGYKNSKSIPISRYDELIKRCNDEIEFQNSLK